MKWQLFTYQESQYSLEHLHPFEFIVVQEAKDKKPSRQYIIDVIFSLHCFSRKRLNGENIKAELLYSDNREARVFCFNRYELSKKLPDIIKSLDGRKCYHTSYGNYFTVDMIGDAGNTEKYEVYFTLSKSNKKGRLNLYVESAYIRSEDHQQGRRKKKPIGFKIIAHNTFTKKVIKLPQ